MNPDHKLPNIMVFVNHCPDIERRDLIATIAGLPVPESNRRLFMLGRKMQEQVIAATRRIDLFLWIDAKGKVLQHLSPNDAPHRQAALDLLGLSSDMPAA